MPYGPIYPASARNKGVLVRDDPPQDDTEHDRQAAAASRLYYSLERPNRRNPDPGFSLQVSGTHVDPGFSFGRGASGSSVDPYFNSVLVRPKVLPNQEPTRAQFRQLAASSGDEFQPAFLDRGLANADDGGEFIDVGNPEHPRVRREWERREGQDWPIDPATGRRYDVAHIKAVADGGKTTVDNVRPLHPAAHRAEHMANGDHARWGRRAGIARAFGGRVAKALGPLNAISGLTGMLSGRIRTDNFDNFANDMMGLPSLQDQKDAFENRQRMLNPQWKPGDPIVT